MTSVTEPTHIAEDGTRTWSEQEHLHRLVGPAVIREGRRDQWWVHGVYICSSPPTAGFDQLAELSRDDPYAAQEAAIAWSVVGLGTDLTAIVRLLRLNRHHQGLRRQVEGLYRPTEDNLNDVITAILAARGEAL